MRKSGRKTIIWNIILLAAVFLVGMAVVFVFARKNYYVNLERRQETAYLNAISYAERMMGELGNGITITDAIEEILVNDEGQIPHFYDIAQDLMTDSIQSIQLAPDGVVTQIYPEEGNEAGKIDLIHDEKRGEITRYGRDKDMVIMQGPFPLNQGGSGIAVRNPVYLQGADGTKSFWGFTIAIIRVPDIFSNSVQALTNFGYAYRLSKTASPLTETYEEIDSSGQKLISPVAYSFELGGCSWKLEVMPSKGWGSGKYSKKLFVMGTMLVMLLTGLMAALLVIEKRRKELKKIAVTDALTGLLNRNGFDEEVRVYFAKYPKEPCIGITFDIDNFKFINDMYGHASGDRALQNLAESMRQFWGKDAILGRNGGDEFCIILKHRTGEAAKPEIEQFTTLPRTFVYDGEAHSFTISLGYAEYPAQASDADILLRNADMALYEVKMHGKQGCLMYHKEIQPKKRSQLGFALKDVSENLPGAFLIYKADKEDDRILFANREMLQLAGCEDMDEFLAYSGQHFRNLICPEEQDAVEQSIWKQILSHEDDTNDYVQFRFVTKDGSLKTVFDHGRIVENSYYGKVFYVMLIERRFLECHYV